MSLARKGRSQDPLTPPPTGGTRSFQFVLSVQNLAVTRDFRLQIKALRNHPPHLPLPFDAESGASLASKHGIESKQSGLNPSALDIAPLMSISDRGATIRNGEPVAMSRTAIGPGRAQRLIQRADRRLALDAGGARAWLEGTLP